MVINVEDDGKGLDPEVLKQIAVEKGLMASEEEYTDRDLLNVIFKAGFTTARTVSNVSGRGVGMDVVKSTIENLKGNVEIISSKPGKGTVVSITLPLTLAIVDGLLVRVDKTYFVLPLSLVEECVELTDADIKRFHGRRVFPVRDQMVSYVRLRDFFQINGNKPELEQMVVVNNNGERNGLVLDDVIGEHQTVLKSLGWVYKNATGLSGATILGNGEVALIIDVSNVINCARREEHAITEIIQ